MNNSKKSGFSLAETMIMLVIVAIIMAVSAPLITKKAAADAKRLILQGQDGGADVVVATGSNQSFGVGLTNPQNYNNDNDFNAKLHVNGGSILNGSVRIGEQSKNDLVISNTGTGVLRISGNDGASTPVTSNVNFDFVNKTVNIATMPDYSKHIVLNTGVVYQAQEDGYLYIGDVDETYPFNFATKIRINIYRNTPSETIYSFPSDIPYSTACTGGAGYKCNYTSGNISSFQPSFYSTVSGTSVETSASLIPIPKGTYFKLEDPDGSSTRYVPFLKAQSRISD